ncbi:SAM hydrolase/SAM-dependent halogenase family protein [Neptunitalea lumnitzerae]|uniref:SAM-dependent chlorinase/fluorinase n=1 Tax=Neptunitalea lumnitzerae TaxID=2965509 RepID=A0ABQ5MJH7_9FLAO|nr:SAM-dependent chlorinase/fluorinase [Neptunitalea sp. Y10]GLB49205.1 hypothetical protein Y10_15730 [Neptunitalea sp. Y10]
MAIITLTSDFGLKDPYVAVLKGGIYSELENATIVDISHLVSPFNIHEGAYILKTSYKKFPKGSIHIIGIDDEQTPEQKHIVAAYDGHYFIGADNGILSLIAPAENFEQVIAISLPDKDLCATDVFVKAACHIARGGRLELLGRQVGGVKEVKDLTPILNAKEDLITGNVIYIDNYGNVITNITKNWFDLIRKGRNFEISVRNYKFSKIYNRYSESINFTIPKETRDEDGKRLALFNELGYLELAIYKSNLQTVGGASSLLGLRYRDTVFINFK